MEKEKEIDESESQNLTLPDDIIFDHILPRLPIKPLTRFKTVSKSWLSTISTPKFAKSQLKLYTSTSPAFLLFSGNRDPHPLFTSVTFDQHGSVEETLKFKYTFKGSGGGIHVVGSCNGLVCFCDKYFNFYICNPITQKCNDVINRLDNSPDFSSDKIISAGFGYVSSIDDYKIACLTGPSNINFFEDQDLGNVYIFSLKNCKWERALSRINVQGVAIARRDVPVMVNDALYWYSADLNHIIKVNLMNSELITIPVIIADVSNLGEPYYHRRVILIGVKGRLCLRCGREVWRLNEDGLSWMKMYDLNCVKMRLLGVCESTGKWLVLNGKLLALLDPSKSFYRQYQGGTHFGGYVFSAWNYNMSLISPLD